MYEQGLHHVEFRLHMITLGSLKYLHGVFSYHYRINNCIAKVCFHLTIDDAYLP